MAGHGPAPKGQHQRERDTKRRQAGAVSLKADGKRRGPALPTSILDPHPETLVYWEAWRLSAQAQLFTDTDWEQLKRAAVLHDYVWKNVIKPSAAAVSELRLIEERFGGSYVDRQRARILLETDVPDSGAQLAAVTPLRQARQSALDRLKGGATQ